ncbi:MAG: RsmF rRNA methyltransferase first C-terminal domain-containing protein, partial [Clostridiales bacterium]|nr:RsmF rRNA methyltransferase first C-terminal domain-containing protein [Clostridiales bacterium]
ALNKNIELMGIRNAVVTNEDPAGLKKNFLGWFDKILIDAPCSGEGMFRKDEEAVKGWLSHSPANCAEKQESILNNAADLLKPGGILLYSTCTFNTMENERRIMRFLDQHGEFEAFPINQAQFGLSGGADGDDSVKTASARIWPHKCDGEGHFMASLRKKASAPAAEKAQEKPKKEKIEGAAYFEQWCAAYLKSELTGTLALRKNALYLEPPDMPDISGIRAYKTGLYLGDLKPKRFEPSTAFALALLKREFVHTIDFSAGSQEVRRYLTGESFDAAANEGYNLFCVEGHPLGFGKVVGGRLKNRRI